MRDDVPQEVKAERLARAQALQDRISWEILENCIGKVEEILVEGPSPRGEGQVTGRTRTNRIVHLKGDAGQLVGRMVKVRVEKSLRHSLWGERVED
jgi:tRNA-2-methylthio-N6-dimethylallyladenosine synthase